MDDLSEAQEKIFRFFEEKIYEYINIIDYLKDKINELTKLMTDNEVEYQSNIKKLRENISVLEEELLLKKLLEKEKEQMYIEHISMFRKEFEDKIERLERKIQTK